MRKVTDGLPVPADQDDPYRILFNNLPDGVLVCDRHGRLLDANPRACELLASTREELTGRPLAEFIADPAPGTGIESTAPAPASGERELRRRDGSRFPVEISVRPLGDDRLICSLRDIRPRQQAAAMLAHQESVLRAVADSMDDGLLVVSASGRITHYNRRFLDLWSIPAALTATGNDQPLLAYVATQLQDPTGFLDRVREIYQGPDKTEDTLQLKDGRVFDRFSQPLPRPADQEPERLWLFRDVTARKQEEAALAKRLIALTQPLDDANSVRFDDLFNLAEIQRIQDSFAEATGVASLITRPDGTPITRPSNFCRLCSAIIRSTAQGRHNCHCSDAILGRHHPAGPVVQPCLSGGLWDAGASITIDGKHVANWLIGQVRDGTQTEEHMRAYARQIGADETEVVAAFREVPTMPRARFEQVAQALFLFANQLSRTAYQNLQQARFITERAKAQEALSTSERQFRSIVENMHDAYMQADLTGRLTMVSPSAARLYGYASPEEMVGVDATTLYHDRSARSAVLATLQSDQAVIDLVLEGRRKDGFPLWVSLNASRIRDDQGRCVGTEAFVRDITGRKLAEQALADEATWRQVLAEQSHDGIVVLDESGRVIEANRHFLETLGYSAEESRALHVWEWDVQWTDAQLQEIIRRQGQDGEHFETRHRRKDGSVFDAEVSVNAATLGGQKRLFCVSRDITERKRAGEALRTSERKLAEIFRSSPEMIGVTTLAEGRFIEVNETFTRLLGYERSETIGHTSVEIGLWPTPEDRARLVDAVRTRGEVNQFETRHRKKNGDIIDVQLAMTPIVLDGQDCLITISADITARKQAELALRASERKLAEIFRSSPEMIVVTHAQSGLLLEVNDACLRMLGYRRDEMLGHTTREINVWPTPDERDRIVGLVRERGLVQNAEVQFRRKDGTLLDVALSMTAITLDGQASLLTIATDITERKRAEQERLELERRLLHSQKLESLGVLAGGIAHDFNNLLMAILGNLDLTLMDLSPVSPARASVEQCVVAARRAADLTRQMLAYSGKGRFDVRHLDLTALVEENAHLFRTCISKIIVLNLQVSRSLPAIKADAGQVQQIIMNLITNASEAVGDCAGAITLATGVLDCDADLLRRGRVDAIPQPGRFVYLEVTDTGCGMDADTQQRLFDPFFTTKFTGRGLGMAALLGIVRGHQGTIIVDSEIGRGTTIRVLFPASDTLPVKAGEADVPAAPGPHAEATILVVDDEDMIRNVCQRMLRRFGWQVLVAADGPEAVKLYRLNSALISCVILDLSMPGMDGMAVFRELRALTPDIKVILSSGYNSDQGMGQRFFQEGLSGFIQKPYTSQALRHEITRVLRRKD